MHVNPPEKKCCGKPSGPESAGTRSNTTPTPKQVNLSKAIFKTKEPIWHTAPSGGAYFEAHSSSRPGRGGRRSLFPTSRRLRPGKQNGAKTRIRWPEPATGYLLQVALTIFRLLTSRSPYSSLLDAFSTCPSFFSSAFDS